MNAFLDGVFFFDFEPFLKEVIVNLSFHGYAFVALFRRFTSLSS